MRSIAHTSRFKRDYKKAARQGRDLVKLIDVIESLAQDLPLLDKMSDHALVGDKKGLRDCHVEPDWILLYEKPDTERLILHRIGSHSDIFRSS